MKRKLIYVSVIFCGFVPLCFSASFQGLGDFSGGQVNSDAYGISGDGSTVVGYGWSENGQQAFRWTLSGGMQSLGVLPEGTYSIAKDVSFDGTVIVGTADSSEGNQAFRWEGGTMTGLGDLSGNDFMSAGKAISANGSVVVGWGHSAFGTEAFRWTASEGIVGLGDLAGGEFSSDAKGVSADGTIVVGYSNTGDASGGSALEAYRWTEIGGMKSIGMLTGSFRSVAEDISADGSAIIGSCDYIGGNSSEAFRWTESSGMKGLGKLSGDTMSWATDASGDGSIVVGRSWALSGNSKAFIWDEINGIQNLKYLLQNEYGLDLTGWILSSANAISDDGFTIAGQGINPDGNSEAWIVTIPEPTTFILLSFGVISLKKH